MSRSLAALLVSSLVPQTAVYATTIYLHRAGDAPLAGASPGGGLGVPVLLWMTTGIVREWVAVHRKHHAFTDEEGDPHSPPLEGFW